MRMHACTFFTFMANTTGYNKQEDRVPTDKGVGIPIGIWENISSHPGEKVIPPLRMKRTPKCTVMCLHIKSL